MTLKIDANQKISAIKAQFNAAFPYLRIEFFKHQHEAKAPSPKTDMITKDMTLNAIKKSDRKYIEIKDDMPVTKLEQLFQKEFGISTQIFRKSGKSWLETSVTDDWTLKRQNEEGMELSQFSF